MLLAAGLTMPASAAMTTEQRLRALENLVNEQQQEIKQLRGELKQQKAIGTATQQQAERAEEGAKATDKKVVASIPGWVNKFTPFGDVRIRQEGFYNQPTTPGKVTTARNRTRLRARVGLKFEYSDELAATVRIASGNQNDPISTNQTDTGNFTPFQVNLDWAYLTFSPGKTFNMRPGLLTINAGKFPNPMFRAGEMVWDDDLAPEGFNEIINVLEHPVGPLDYLKIHAEQWTFQETSNAEDGWIFGGQINPAGHVGNVLLEAGLGQYWYLNPDTIATSAITNSSLVLTNSVDKDSKGTITGYSGAFNESNFTLAATIPDVGGNMPLRFWTDYVYNWEAPDTRAHGVQGGVRLGSPKEQGDWAASLLYEYLEQNAVNSTFSWSDFGTTAFTQNTNNASVSGGTNLQGPVIQLDYQLLKPLTLTARTYFVKYIDPPADYDNRMSVRLQLDAMYRF